MENMEKKNILDRFQDYLDTAKGRIQLNYLYSWGAAIVILGALFKLTHIAGANLMLFIGMGTEVIVFFISAFEKPFIPEPENEQPETGDIEEFVAAVPRSSAVMNPEPQQAPVIVGGGQLNVDGLESVTQNYISQVSELTEKLNRISGQSDLMQRSTEEIEALGRNLVSLNKFYELHLRSASSQMDNIDKVKEQTAEMVRQIEELNKVYARMVEALKVNSGISSSDR